MVKTAHDAVNPALNGIPPGGASENTWALSRSNSNSTSLRTRVSLNVRDAPLAQVLGLIENMAPVRFRYGALPDAVVSADLRDVALLPALEYLLRGVSWQTRHADTEIFLLRRQTPEEVAAQIAMRPALSGNSALEALSATAPGANPLSPGVTAAIAGWRCWSGVQPPPRRWMAMEEPKAPPPSSTMLTEKNSGGATDRAGSMAGKENLRGVESPDTSSFWHDAAIFIEAQRRPGIRLLVPAPPMQMPAGPVSTTVGQAPVWLRWRMRLSFVPRDARLLLETPIASTLYVNGAPLLARWSGMRLVDLSNVLHRGDNVLALHWATVPREMLGAANAAVLGAGDEAPTPVLLRYEWLCDASGGAVTSNGE